MEFDAMPVTTATTTTTAAAAAAARPEQESDGKGGRPRHVWSAQEEDVLYRIWGRDNYLLTKHGKNTVFFAQWADEMRDKYDIVVRPEEVQQKVNTTRAKFRQVKKLMAQGNMAHKWKKFDLVSLILRNEYRPEGADPLPPELLGKNRDISPSELTQMVGSQSPTAPNHDNSREEGEVGPFDTSLTGLQVNNQLMGNPLFGEGGSGNGVGAAVDDGLSGELFGDALAALSEEDIKSNFMQYQFQPDQPNQDEQQQLSQQDNEQKQTTENGQQTSAEREQILLAQAQQQLQQAYQLEQQQQQHEPQQLQQQQHLQPQQHESQLKQHLLQQQQHTHGMQEQQHQQLLLQQHQQAMQQQQQNASYNHTSVVVSNPAAESSNNNLVNNPGTSSAISLPGSANATEAPKLIHATTVDNPNVAWGLKATPLTTAATFDRPLNNYVYKPQNPRPAGQQQARKRRQVTSEPHSNGTGTANGDSMEMLYLSEVRKRNCLLEEQRDISLKRLELERRKVSMMEQFFPRCLEMQQAILSQLRPGT